MKKALQSICAIFILSMCSESEPSFEENIVLKSNLQGTWKRTIVTGPSLLVNQLTFTDYVTTWYDSTVNMTDELNGEIQTIKGTCPVAYTFNDGIEHYNPSDLRYVYRFSGTTENDILWVFIEDGEPTKIVDYQIVDGQVTETNRWTTAPIPSYISSSYVRFTNNLGTAAFCLPSSPCITYDKIK